MKYIPVPCPICEGLVVRDTIKCTRCGVSWPSILRMCGEGVSKAQTRANKIAEVGVWTKETVVENIQAVIDMFVLSDRYYKQMEIELR